MEYTQETEEGRKGEGGGGYLSSSCCVDLFCVDLVPGPLPMEPDYVLLVLLESSQGAWHYRAHQLPHARLEQTEWLQGDLNVVYMYRYTQGGRGGRGGRGEGEKRDEGRRDRWMMGGRDEGKGRR